MKSRGLNSWFGRLVKKAIVFVAGVADNYTAGVFEFKNWAKSIGTAEEHSGFWDRVATAEPTPAEEVILTAWNNQRFAPFVGRLAAKIVEMQSLISADQQVAVLNEVYAQMAGVREYFLTNEISGLSQNGVDNRTDIIDESFAMLKSKVEPIIQALQVLSSTTTVLSFGNVFGTLIVQYSNVAAVECEKFSTLYEDQAPVPVVQIIQTTNAAQNAAAANSTSTGTSNKFSTVKKVGFVAVAIGLIAWAWQPENKKSKKK